MKNFKYDKLISALTKLESEPILSSLSELARSLVVTINSGNKVLFFGNGGSAAEASHFAAELVSKCSRDHKPWPAICLNDSSPVLTAIGNDYGFDDIFRRQVEAFANPNDLIVALSTSGRSKNILAALNYANKVGLKSFLLTGPTFDPELECITISAPISDTPRIQEIHLIWIHFLSEYCEENIG
jgi:D-sedoheptulose 7-phosphate isomerase